jgi:EmrB/QacA subfamily drug resistance transporter
MGDPRVNAPAQERSPGAAVAACSFGASLLTPFMVSSVNIALPAIARDLSMSAVAMSWVTTAYLLCCSVLLIPFGRLADTYGRRKFFAAGMFMVTVSSLLSAIAPSAELLIATRMLHGIGAAMIFGTGMAMLTSAFPPHERGKMLGINVSFTYAGLTLGPFLGGLLTHHFGWRSIFLVNVPAGAAIFTVAVALVREEWTDRKAGSFDITGALLYAAAISFTVIGFSGLTRPYGAPLAAAGLAAGALFLAAESHAELPILPVSLFRRNRVFACSNLAAFINYGATYAVGFLMSLYLQYVKGMTPQAAGLFIIIQPVVMVVVSPLAGRISDRVEPRIPASIGMGCITAGLLLLSLLDAPAAMLRIAGIMVLFGCGFALFSSPNTSAVMGSVDKNSYGVASASVGTMRLLGQVLSMGFTMLLMSIMIGPGTITPAHCSRFLTMMHAVCRLFALLSTAGIGVSLVRGNVHPAAGAGET